MRFVFLVMFVVLLVGLWLIGWHWPAYVVAGALVALGLYLLVSGKLRRRARSGKW